MQDFTRIFKKPGTCELPQPSYICTPDVVLVRLGAALVCIAQAWCLAQPLSRHDTPTLLAQAEQHAKLELRGVGDRDSTTATDCQQLNYEGEQMTHPNGDIPYDLTYCQTMRAA